MRRFAVSQAPIPVAKNFRQLIAKRDQLRNARVELGQSRLSRGPNLATRRLSGISCVEKSGDRIERKSNRQRAPDHGHDVIAPCFS